MTGGRSIDDGETAMTETGFQCICAERLGYKDTLVVAATMLDRLESSSDPLLGITAN